MITQFIYLFLCLHSEISSVHNTALPARKKHWKWTNKEWKAKLTFLTNWSPKYAYILFYIFRFLFKYSLELKTSLSRFCFRVGSEVRQQVLPEVSPQDGRGQPAVQTVSEVQDLPGPGPHPVVQQRQRLGDLTGTRLSPRLGLGIVLIWTIPIPISIPCFDSGS